MSADVFGQCPACGHKALFLAVGGHVTCRIAECSDPGAASDMLANPGYYQMAEDALKERNGRLDRIERIARGEDA